MSLITVPFHAGDERSRASKGPDRLVDAGAAQLLAAHGLDVVVEAIERREPFRDTATSSALVNRELAGVVRRVVDADRLPIVLSGSCNSALGVLAGFDHGRCGAVWLDAHADFNTPESTASGFFPGMSVAVVTGHCYRDYWAQIGDSTPLAEEAIAMFGVRDVSPEAELERVEHSALRIVGWCDGRPEGDILETLDEVARRVDDAYLHVDFDALDPEVAPGVSDDPVPGGLSLEDAATIVRATGERFRVRAVTLATYAPECDDDGKTLRVALRLIELLGEYAASRRAA